MATGTGITSQTAGSTPSIRRGKVVLVIGTRHHPPLPQKMSSTGPIKPPQNKVVMGPLKQACVQIVTKMEGRVCRVFTESTLTTMVSVFPPQACRRSLTVNLTACRLNHTSTTVLHTTPIRGWTTVLNRTGARDSAASWMFLTPGIGPFSSTRMIARNCGSTAYP